MANPQQALDNGSALLSGFTQDFRTDLANGDYSKFAGRVSGTIVSFLFGSGEAGSLVNAGRTAEAVQASQGVEDLGLLGGGGEVPNGEVPLADATNQAAEAPTAQIRDVDPRQLVSRQGSDEMDQDAVRVLRQDMEEYGYDTTYPIDAAEVDGQLIIQDGHHRVQAAIGAQIPEIPVRINPVTSAQANKLGQEATQVLFGNPWEW
jgi:hypothetical protein